MPPSDADAQLRTDEVDEEEEDASARFSELACAERREEKADES